ncbi:pilin [Dyella lutea]|uniref:Pilin n=1 Tax=Dyella lutea TaxID=2950441 RepID=A0ABT1F9Q2_9GAMM|nr:pilin [Dyella lutea]MCP1374089.1 pilin [Dyella lutea]
MRQIRGFTLIELMIVVAIIAILASLAVTVYTNSTGKAELSEAFTVVDGLKTDVAEYYTQNGSCPTSGNSPIETATSYSGKYVERATVAPGASGCVITAFMRTNSVTPRLRGKTVTFSMSPLGSGSFQWACSTDAPANYVPRSCQ